MALGQPVQGEAGRSRAKQGEAARLAAHGEGWQPHRESPWPTRKESNISLCMHGQTWSQVVIIITIIIVITMITTMNSCNVWVAVE